MAAVSVVTPVSNGERYIEETIASVQAQSFEDWEYWIVDGNSTDRTLELVRHHAALDPRIHYLSEPDRGMYDALFKGLERSHAPLCCWINADDRFMPWAFESAQRYMRATHAEWITGVAAYLDAKSVLHSVGAPKWYPRSLIRLGLFHGRCLGFIQQEGTFFSRALLEKVSPALINRVRAQKVAGDFLFWAALSQHTSLKTLPTVLAAFRIHDSNASAEVSAYYREVTQAGYPVPPGFLGQIASVSVNPVLHAVGRFAAARWRRRINTIS